MQQPARDDAPPQGKAGDLTLRAGADGSTARVHRGMVAAFLRVLEDVLGATEDDELPLLGKSKAQLDVLVAWLYRHERFSMVSVKSPRAWASATHALSCIFSGRATWARNACWRRSTTFPAC